MTARSTASASAPTWHAADFRSIRYAVAFMTILRFAPSAIALSRGSVASTVLGYRRRVRREFRMPGDECHHVVERRDRDDRNAVHRAHFLHRRCVTLAALHPVERDQHTRRFRA